MSFTSWLRGVKAKRSNILPRLQILEDRCVPAQLVDLGLTYHGGPLLSHVEVEAVFWGQDYQTAAGLTLSNVTTPAQQQVNQLSGFLRYITNSPYMDLLTEYSIPGHQDQSSHPSVIDQLTGALSGDQPVDQTDNRTTSDGIPIGRGSFIKADIVADATSPAANTTVYDSGIQKMLGREIQR